MSAATVFVIDDDAGMRRALTRLLESEGFRVEAFESARAFLERAPYPGIGCAVLDLQMPEMTGLALHERMTERGIGLPVVFLTGHGDVPSSVQAMKKGAVDFLLKPVEDEALLGAVKNALARHAAGNEREALRQAILERLARLSPRQREVMHHVIRGRLNKQIAADLDISLKTVKTHRGRVMATMEYGSVAELVRACELAGVEPG